jgi:hypothetical protein
MIGGWLGTVKSLGDPGSVPWSFCDQRSIGESFLQLLGYWAAPLDFGRPDVYLYAELWCDDRY